MSRKKKELNAATIAKRVRAKVLEARGLEKGTYGRLTQPSKEVKPKGLPGRAGSSVRDGKTPMMLAMEVIFKGDIDSLLTAYPEESKVAKMMGLDQSTISKWRLKRGLRLAGGLVKVSPEQFTVQV